MTQSDRPSIATIVRGHPPIATSRHGAYRAAGWLTALAIPLSAVASLAGLIVPERLYGEAGVAAIIQGQDLVTLLAVPALVGSLIAARGGSSRALIVWAGLLGYLLYTYTGAALVYDFNELFLVYVALFAISAFALALLVAAIDVEALRGHFDGHEPRRTVATFLAFIAVALGVGELAQVLSAIASGEAPVIEGTDAPLNFVYTLDLGIIVPLSALGAWLLWRQSAWAPLLAGLLLIKAATMGLALLSMGWFAGRADLPPDALAPLWALIAVGGLALSIWFLRHCDGGSDPGKRS